MSELLKINWQCKSFSELTSFELYDLLQLRNEVFVVEQNCVYQDCDGKDKKAFHLSGYKENNLMAYARLLPKGVSYVEGVSIGRIVTSPSWRGTGIGKELMKVALSRIEKLFGEETIIISAQAHLVEFYSNFGFMEEGKKYFEDGIPHVLMKKPIHKLSQ